MHFPGVEGNEGCRWTSSIEICRILGKEGKKERKKLPQNRSAQLLFPSLKSFPSLGETGYRKGFQNTASERSVETN